MAPTLPDNALFLIASCLSGEPAKTFRATAERFSTSTLSLEQRLLQMTQRANDQQRQYLYYFKILQEKEECLQRRRNRRMTNEPGS